MTAPIRVLLADDDPLVLSGLKIMLAAAKQIHVVGEAHDGREVLPAADMHHPDIVLMDIRMPRLDGIAATAALRAVHPEARVLVVSEHDQEDIRQAAGRAGAAGHVRKDDLTELRRWLEGGGA